MRLVLLLILILTGGCTTMEHNTLVSPSEALYYKANQFYENKEFNTAVVYYEDFLEAKPRSELAIPAKLNLGMSHYYLEDFKQAYLTLKDIDIKDENIKKYVDEILSICKDQAGNAIKAEEQAQRAQAAEKGTAGQIKIDIFDAYVDDFGEVVLTGQTNRIASVTVDGRPISLDGNNMFTASVSWLKGNPIEIVAKDDNGNTDELNYFPDSESPEKPRGLRVINTTSNSIEIEWDNNTEDDIKGYKLFYRLKGGSIREVPDIIQDTKYELVGLQSYVQGANRTFEFYLRAVDKMNNESEDSDTLEVVLP